MKTTKFRILSLISFGACTSALLPMITLSACSQDPSPQIEINIVGNSYLLINTSTKYSVEFSPSSEKHSIVWSVDHEERATITQDGQLTAKGKMGIVTITAKVSDSQDVIATKEVLILNEPRIVIEGEQKIVVGHEYDFKAHVCPETLDQEVKWSVAAEPEVATIDEDTGHLKVFGNGGDHHRKFSVEAEKEVEPGKIVQGTFVVEVLNPPKSLEIVLNEEASHTSHIYSNTELNFDVKVNPTTADEDVTWSLDPSSQSFAEILDVRWGNVKILPNAVGGDELKLIATPEYGDPVSKTFTVEPRPAPTNIKVESSTGDTEFYIDDDHIIMRAIFYDSWADDRIEWSIDTTESTGEATIEPYGEMPFTSARVKPTKAGTITVVATSIVDPDIVGTLTIKIIERP